MRESGKNKAITLKNPKVIKRVQSYLKINNYPAYILFLIGFTTGYRGGDLVELTVLDLREAIASGKLIVMEHKTEKTRKVPHPRVVYLGDKVINILKEFIKDKEDAEYVYSSRSGKGKGKYRKNVLRSTLGKEFKKAVNACGITNVSVGTHTPRKSYGYFQYLEHNKDIYFVQELFGHSSPQVTKRYIGIDDDDLKESSKIMDNYI